MPFKGPIGLFLGLLFHFARLAFFCILIFLMLEEHLELSWTLSEYFWSGDVVGNVFMGLLIYTDNFYFV